MWSVVYWIFSVVIVSFLVNIAANKAMPHIDKQMEKWSDYRRVTNERKKAYIDKQVKLMLDDRDYFLYVLARRTEHLQRVSVLSFLLLWLAVYPAFHFDFSLFTTKLATELEIFFSVKPLFQTYLLNPPVPMTLLFIGWILAQGIVVWFFLIMTTYFTRDTVIIVEYFKRKDDLKPKDVEAKSISTVLPK